MMAPRPLASLISRPPALPEVGDYLTDGRELYCVERLSPERALIEDCRTGKLIDVELGDLAAFERVRRARSAEAEGGPEAGTEAR